MADSDYPSQMIPRHAAGTVAPRRGRRLNRRGDIDAGPAETVVSTGGDPFEGKTEEQIAAGCNVADLNRVGSGEVR